MKKAVTLGEIMLRLSPPSNERFIQAHSFDITFGGAEANVAVSLAMLGHNAEYITKLPDNPIGESAVASLRRMNVKTDRIIRGGKRIGVYFLENGSSVRPSSVVYDRAGSAFSEAECAEFDFDSIFADADIFHICGITPAVSENGARIALAAVEAAKRHNVTVSFDVNYRSKLWSVPKAASVIKRLVPYADILFANAWDAKNLMGIALPDNAGFDVAAREISKQLGTKYVLCSNRVCHSASNNEFSAMVYSSASDNVYTSRNYPVSPIVDRVGTGDSFAAGFLSGILDEKNCDDALEFAVACATLCHTISGDFNYITKSEAEALSAGDASGKVKR